MQARVSDARSRRRTPPAPRSTTASAAPTADGDYEITCRRRPTCRRRRGPTSSPIPHGGFLVTERGAGFTWAENSYFFRLTPWHNDPVSDPPSEVLYLRDEETGERLVPDAGAAPRRRAATPSATAPGATTFEHEQRRHRDRRSPSAWPRTRRREAVAAPADQPGDRAAPPHRSRRTSSGPSACCASTPSTRCSTVVRPRPPGDPRAEHLRPAVRRPGRVLRD